MALTYHASFGFGLMPLLGSQLVAGNGAVVNEDHLSLPNYNSGVYPETPIALGSTYTISMWFKDLKDRSGAQSGWMMMDATSDGGGSNGNHGGSVGGYTMSIYTADELGAWDTAWRGSGYAMTQADYTGNGWHQIVASFDNGTLTYYIDGAQVGSPVAYAGSSSIEVFGSWLNYSYGFADYIDDIRVYDHAATSGEVSALFALGRKTLNDNLETIHQFDVDGSDLGGNIDASSVSGTFVTAASRSFVTLDGSSDEIIFPAAHGAIWEGQDASMKMWFKTTQASGALYQAREVYGGGAESIWKVTLDNGLMSDIFFRNASGTGSSVTLAPSTPVNDGQWHMLLMVKEGATMSLYLDGALEAQMSVAATGFNSGTDGRIGSYSAGSGAGTGSFLAVSVDELASWSRALNATEAALLFDLESLADDKLVGHWTFDGGDATASVGVDGTNNGGSFETHEGHTAVSLSSGDYIQIDNAGANFTTEDFSAAFWFYNEGWDAPAGDWSALIGNQNGVGGNGFGWAIQRYYADDTLFTIQSGDGGPNWSNNHPTQFAIPLNTWTHVVLTRVGTEMKIYLNGADSGYTGSSYATIAHLGDELRIGQHLHMPATSLGKYDDVRVYSKALSAVEVYNLYTATTVIDLTADLVAKYPLDSDVSDSLGSNDGSSHGGASFETDGDIGAMRLTSTGDYAQIPQGLDIGSGGAYTFSVWVKPDNFDSVQVLISDHVHMETYPSLYIQLEQTTGNVSVRHYDSNSASAQTFTSTGSPVAGQWNLVTVGWDGSNANVYLNGVLDSAGALTYAPWNASAPYRIGADTVDNLHVRGLMDDLRIWSQPLDSDAVAALYAAGADAAIAPPAPGNTIDVTIDMFDSYGDSWNGGSISIADSNGAVVYSSTGPANGVKAPAGLSESGSFEPGTYTYTMTPGSYPGEITCTITDEYGTVLANLVGNSGTGTFDLAAPSPVITPTLTTSNGDITIAATLNAEATAAGAIGWAYSLSPLGAEGQPHGGTLLALGLDATVTPGTYEVHTVYIAAVDASGNVIVANSDTIDNTPSISVTIVKADSYNDSWDGTSLVITHDGTGDELYNATLASGASPLTVLVDLPYGTYSWALVGGNYHNEHTVTITLTSDGSQLAHSAGHSPSSGSFTVGPPAAAIDASVSVSGADITVTGTANATAVSDGAANWSASLTEYGAVGAVIDGAKALTALGADAVITAPGGGMHTVYVAVVDASGLIIAKSSVDASVFISQLEVGDQMILMTYLSHPSLSPAGTHAQLTNDDGDLKWGPFYVGDLTIKSITPVSSDESEILQSITFDDGSGGTLNLNELTKELIKKYDLNMLFGDNSNDGLFFQSVIDGTAPIDGAGQLLVWDGSDSLTVMLEAEGGGWVANYDTLVDPYYDEVSEFPPGSEDAYGPDGSSFVGTIAPGEVAPAQVVGAPAKIRIKFGGAIYTSSVVIKDGNGDWFAAFAGEAMAYGNNYYHADALAARDDGKFIHIGDSNAYNSDGNGTPKGSAIGIMTALDGGDSYEIAGYTFEYDMAFPEGDYTIHAYAGYDQGALPTSVYILDADDNLVAQVVSDGSGFDNTYYPVTIGTPAPAAYEWTHGGQLVSIKHFEIGESIGGASAYGYTKEEPGEGTTTMYFASDFQTWSTFTQYTALQSGIEGAPMCLSHGAANLWLLGTDGGKVYEIALLDADASTATFTEVWSSPTEEPINAVKFDAGTSRWIFESGDALYTMDQGGTNAQSQVSLLAGEKVVDIQAGEGYIVYVVRKADYSFELLVSDSAWGNVKDSSQMQPILASHAAIDVNYDPIADLWTASSADGQVIMTDDLSNWLL